MAAQMDRLNRTDANNPGPSRDSANSRILRILIPRIRLVLRILVRRVLRRVLRVLGVAGACFCGTWIGIGTGSSGTWIHSVVMGTVVVVLVVTGSSLVGGGGDVVVAVGDGGTVVVTVGCGGAVVVGGAVCRGV